jgi:hypothetical protein
MEAIILDNTPVSGEYPEVHFGDDFYDGIWVKFTDSNYEMWIGHFLGLGKNTSDKVLVSHDKKKAFVLSGYRGYIVDIDTRELKYKTNDEYYIHSLIQTSSPDYFIATTYSSVCIFDENKMIKELFPNFLGFDVDGIFAKEQEENYVLGEFETNVNRYYQTVEFVMDLNTFEFFIDQDFTIESFVNYDRDVNLKVNISKKWALFKELFSNEIIQRRVYILGLVLWTIANYSSIRNHPYSKSSINLSYLELYLVPALILLLQIVLNNKILWGLIFGLFNSFILYSLVSFIVGVIESYGSIKSLFFDIESLAIIVLIFFFYFITDLLIYLIKPRK